MAQEQWMLEELLSPARMAPYLAVTTGSWDRALQFYDWNACIGAAFFESVHYLEIGLRNAFDGVASDRLGVDWLTSARSVLSPRSRAVVSHATHRAGGTTVPRGKLIAELPFGFWWSLLADEYNRRLWQPALRFAFEDSVRRRRLHAELDDLRRLRNRIAHHEPIHSRDLGADYARILTIAHRVGTALGDHIALTSRVTRVLEERDQRGPVGA